MRNQPKITSEQAKELLWYRGNLSWKLRPEQTRLLELLNQAPTDLAVFNICRRFGKSTTCVLYCIEAALKSAQHIRYATAFLTDLEGFITPLFDWVLQDCPAAIRPQFKAAKKEYHFPNGSKIKLVGLDKNPNGLRGNAIDILIVDEAAFVSNLDYLYRSVIVPATMKRKFKLIFPSTPPESPEHFWAKELINKAKAKNSYIELTIDSISDLPLEERNRLLDEVGGEFSPTAQREFFCKIMVDITRTLAPSFKSDLHVKEHSGDHISWGYFGDSGGLRDKTVFLKVGFDQNLKKVIVFDELVFEPNTTTSTIISTFKKKFGDRQTITLDAPGQLQLDYSAAGLPASLPSKDNFDAGLLLLNNHFHQNQIQITPACKLLIRTIEGGMLTKNRSDYERSEALGHCDAVAALIYALRGVDKITDLRPRANPEDIFIRERQPPHIKQLAKMGFE